MQSAPAWIPCLHVSLSIQYPNIQCCHNITTYGSSTPAESPLPYSSQHIICFPFASNCSVLHKCAKFSAIFHCCAPNVLAHDGGLAFRCMHFWLCKTHVSLCRMQSLVSSKSKQDVTLFQLRYGFVLQPLLLPLQGVRFVMEKALSRFMSTHRWLVIHLMNIKASAVFSLGKWTSLESN